MTPTRHLVSVWNPAYAVDAMDAHVAVLVERARAHREGHLESEDDVHVWWGRIRSPRRHTPRPHLADVLDLQDQLDADTPTYLYLTDYSSLYVADLAHKAGIPCVPHSANVSLVTVFTLHMMGAIPNAGPHIEFSIEPRAWTEGLYSPALEVRDGAVQIPDGPGWGVEINTEWLAAAERQVSELD